ncbi:MAG TPA: metalloregulator ArsR/SmtB family transcription factor [Acidobacteriaceae bacterium]|nr:metalloregulator ArsR/SmtB family transcription factor [Acidobacteriaceae bacterium]
MRQSRQQNAVFRAVADPTRRQILGILRGGRQTVGSIAGNFRMSRPAISKHIHQLHKAGLVETRSEGTTTVCTLNAKPLREVGTWLRDYEAFWSASLNNLKQYLEEEKG